MKTNPQTFFLKLVLFTATALMPCMVAYILLYAGGELITVGKVVELQLEGRMFYFGLAYSNPAVSYKLRATQARKPEVLALGTSRVMPFRSTSFVNSGAFYNAGGGIEQLGDFRPFLDRIPQEHQPKVLIIGLDQYFFNDCWIDNNKKQHKAYLSSLEKQTDILDLSNNELLRVLRDLASNKIPVQAILNHDPARIGINAIVKGDGFANDGSYHYGAVSGNPGNPKHSDYQFRDTISRIEQGTNRFEYGGSVSHRSLEELKALLALCSKRGIHVVGFLPPYAHEVYLKMKQKGECYRYLDLIQAGVKGEFDRYGYSFFDFSDLARTGAGDEETTDGFHGSESAYRRIFCLMAAQDPHLAKYAKP